MADTSHELAWEEHCRIGAELHSIRQRIGELAARLSEIYGTGARVTGNAERAQKSIDDLRQELDALLFREHSSMPRMELMRVYYGGEDSPSIGNRTDQLPFE
jgi:hypothetical protein